MRKYRKRRGSAVEPIRIDFPNATDSLITVLHIVITQGCPTIDGFNFSSSVHHVQGRLRALCGLISGRFRLPSVWLHWLLMNLFYWSELYSGRANLWEFEVLSKKGAEKVLTMEIPGISFSFFNFLDFFFYNPQRGNLSPNNNKNILRDH